MAGIGGTDERSAEKLGYLGLGMMGFPMTRRLVSAGYDVTVWNRSPGKAAALVAAGARAALHPSDVAATASILFMCLTDAAAVEEVVFGPDGLATATGSGRLVVDFSSIHPDAARAIAARLKLANGMGWIDAPVSGGTIGAEEGTLAVMAGGDAADIERARPYVLAMARRVHPNGPNRSRPDHQALQSGDRRLRHGRARGGDTACSECRDRRQAAAGGTGRRLCRFHTAAIIRTAHGARHSFAAARPYRNDAERSGYGRRRRPRHIEPGPNVGAGRTIVQTGEISAWRGCRCARNL